MPAPSRDRDGATTCQRCTHIGERPAGKAMDNARREVRSNFSSCTMAPSKATQPSDDKSTSMVSTACHCSLRASPSDAEGLRFGLTVLRCGSGSRPPRARNCIATAGEAVSHLSASPALRKGSTDPAGTRPSGEAAKARKSSSRFARRRFASPQRRCSSRAAICPAMCASRRFSSSSSRKSSASSKRSIEVQAAPAPPPGPAIVPAGARVALAMTAET
mmetsp:Transcript_118411/g.339939  ORF Transcript_118411/g.339939 Transcript_118411/m.339939 type:complete len:218 (+) Transcript_118411:1021-1674(+)